MAQGRVSSAEWEDGKRIRDGLAAASVFDQRDQLIGAVLDGRYRILDVISSGGVGTVYRAEQVTLVRREVAVKLLRPSLVPESGRVRRFEDEVRITAKLRHPNTVRVLDSGRLENGQIYLVTELLVGAPLDILLAHGPLAPAHAVSIARQICASMREAHEEGIVHRDLKPSNIFLERVGGQEIVKVLDFGMARQQSVPGLTMPTKLCGTPGYMAPEQILGLRVDGRADIYALGVILYQALSGAPPFTADSPMNLLARHLEDVPEPLWSQTDNVLHTGLERLVLAMLEKEPVARPTSMAEVDMILERIARELANQRDLEGEEPAISFEDPVEATDPFAPEDEPTIRTKV